MIRSLKSTFFCKNFSRNVPSSTCWGSELRNVFQDSFCNVSLSFEITSITNESTVLEKYVCNKYLIYPTEMVYIPACMIFQGATCDCRNGQSYQFFNVISVNWNSQQFSVFSYNSTLNKCGWHWVQVIKCLPQKNYTDPVGLSAFRSALF